MRRTRLLSAAFRRAALALLVLGPGAWGTPPPAGPAPLTAATPPIRLQRFALPGPLAGVLAQVDLKDPRVRVELVMAEGAAPGPAPGAWAGRLEVPSAVARAHGLALALNASFFRAEAVERDGRKLAYVVGNGANPVGWHVSGGQVRSRPTAPRFRAALVVRTSGRVTVEPRLEEVPTDARCVVSGNALVLQGGEPVPSRDEARHPRSAVGLSADGRTLLLVAVDGRQEHSRGATLEELGRLLKDFGATDALNLDGGGSTAMAARDPVTGVIAVLNRPSDLAPGLPDTRVERPVADVLGIVLREPASAPPRVP